MATNMIIISAPSGAGKSSFIDRILKKFPVLFDTITYTTRSPRSSEQQGDPYYFVSRDEFLEKVQEGFFVEWAHVHEDLYGTPLRQIQEAHAEGRVVIMDVDVKGARTFKEKYPDAASVFILPPSLEELRRRILSRDQKAPDNLEIRLQNAQIEMDQASHFDFKVVNDDFEASYAQFETLVAELIGD